MLDFVDGKTLQQLMDENPDKMQQYLEEFVDLQVEVLSQKVPLLTKLKDKMHRKISSTNFDKTTRYDLHILLDSLPAHDKLCHGDFNPGNIIVSPDGRKFIIDWAHATQGNARCDAARTYLLFKLEGKDDVAEEYLKLFCEKTGIAKQLVQKALPIVAASPDHQGRSRRAGIPRQVGQCSRLRVKTSHKKCAVYAAHFFIQIFSHVRESDDALLFFCL